jgi:hypothetical protein
MPEPTLTTVLESQVASAKDITELLCFGVLHDNQVFVKGSDDRVLSGVSNSSLRPWIS